MLGVAIGELVLLAIMQAVFTVRHVRSPGWWRLPDGHPNLVGRLLAMWPVIGLMETLSLIALGTGHAPPLGTYMVVFALTIVVMAGWLHQQSRARRAECEREP